MKLIFGFLLLAFFDSAYGRYFDLLGLDYDQDHGQSIYENFLDGEAVPIEKAPFMALVAADRSLMSTYPFATAVIISDRFLLSSNSFFFVQRGKGMTAYLGEDDLKSLEGKDKYKVEGVFIHEMFKEESFYHNNISLIKLKEKIKFNDVQRPISLLSANDAYERDVKIWQIYSYEFSKIAEDEKTMGELTKRNVILNSNTSSDGPITVYGTTKICPGDAGAPLIMDNKLVALATDQVGCDNKFSSHFIVTGVRQYYLWIEDVVGKENLDYAEKNAYPKKIENDNTITF